MEPASWASTGSQELARRKALPLLQTGNATLDQLLGGGIEPGVLTLLYSASRRLSLLLQQLAVLAQLPPPDGGLNAGRVVYVDAENTFDPYGVSNCAVAHRLDPRRVLGNIFLARAFQWGQAVEIVREKMVIAATAKDTPLVCIAGLTTMLSPADQAKETGYEGILQVIQGLKDLLARTRDGPAIVATTRLHPASGTKPLGGNALRHFAQVLVRVEDRPKVTEYLLERHPARAPQKLLDFKDTKGAKPAFKAYTLDFFLKRNGTLDIKEDNSDHL